MAQLDGGQAPPASQGGRRSPPETALRLARYFGTTKRFWLNLQGRHDLEVEKDRLGGVLDAIEPLRSA